MPLRRRHSSALLAIFAGFAAFGCDATPESPTIAAADSSLPTDPSPGSAPTDLANATGTIPAATDGSHQWTDEEILAALHHDSDGDGSTDLAELTVGTDPLDASSGGDLDGDGIFNRDDPDVDGDGLSNAEDSDIDGDGLSDGEDADADGDGLLAPEDDDDDGDGVLDAVDNDDNGDGEPDCDCEHGVCSSFGGLCFCDRGWKGESCDEFHCKDVHNCYNGTCIGPNACRCDSGWESLGGNPCFVFHCRDRANCSGHGRCVGPNSCECDADWKGRPDCSRQTCASVPSLCDDNDLCTTDTCDPMLGCKHKPVTCLGFLECVRGECVYPCMRNADCDDGGSCQGGGCFTCKMDSECGDGDRCTIDTCDPQSGCMHENVVCPLFEDCVFGQCVGECTADSDCSSGESCKDGGCVPKCDSDDDCGDDETCDDGVCTPPPEDEGG